MADNYRGPQPLHVDPNDASPWARTYQILREGPESARAHERAWLEQWGLVERVAQLARDGVGLRREPRAEGEEDVDG